MKIYDKTGAERDWAWLQATFGLGVSLSERPRLAEPGYSLVELRAKEGPCTLVARVLDAAGSPAAGIDVARWWNDPALPDLPPNLAYWHPHGVHGLTNQNGDIGFGMGGGDGYDPAWPPEGLPVSEIWAQDNSDRIHGLGWVWGTNHLHLDVTFQLVQPGEPPPDPPGVADLIRHIGKDLTALADLLDV
jgi:hypothetical protein